MNQQIQATAIIRQRGQLTIPDFIREVTGWIVPGSVISVSRVKSDEIVIKPHNAFKGQTDWDKIWRNIKLARSYRGKYRGSLSQYIIDDRNRH